MKKLEAAKFLDISEKTLERLVKSGEISSKLEKGKTRDVVVFDDKELEAYKEKRESAKHRPAFSISDDSPAQNSVSLIPTKADNRDTQNQTLSFTPLITALDSLAEAQRMAFLQKKPMLNISDSALVSGLAVTFLEKAVKDGRLKTFAGLRGSKVIRRTDLEKFISEL
jgi:DNA-directed RNA polymerase specialized sigma24 family protein